MKIHKLKMAVSFGFVALLLGFLLRVPAHFYFANSLFKKKLPNSNFLEILTSITF